MIPNSGLRVMSDANAALAQLTMLYIDWLARQLLPDTAEKDFLDRHAAIWLPNNGRKSATLANGGATITGITGKVLPAGSQFQATSVDGTTTYLFQSGNAVTLSGVPTPFTFTAITAGHTGLAAGDTLALNVGISGINGTATITSIADGINGETDDELRVRVLARIQQPPVGGDANDFVQWVLATPGVAVTRAWCSPNEIGAGTVTLRFMVDDLLNEINVFPTAQQATLVTAYVDTVRPVCLKDRFVFAPTPEPINFAISGLSPDTVANRNAIQASVNKMLFERAAPAHAINGVTQGAQTIYAEWVSDAISQIASIDHFTLLMSDHPMPFKSSLAILGTITYG
jgi:uncharacterized phage protein gp47/JayE